ncbi:DUF1715-domain-containing protein [Mycena indigotica]|uniref:DUF1715-domain-containing protein n=1 Tax=Mycena indigotica TaxID=2126181 RepID=A0A8H6S970_9AGAR|nr:DUF1715-domain-containing protein [Mycena indigotica]KAF7295153.1 DUF1715-domain-containing protein [Mycena indigotica]
MEFDLEALVNVEATFYDAGYKDGHAHGRIHGLIEGRALGREKGYEMWEELAFYQGFARTWLAIYPRNDDRTAHHIRHLLELLAQFPQVNPSATDSELDILKLSRQISSRYRALCASLGVKASREAPSVWKLENAAQTMSF